MAEQLKPGDYIGLYIDNILIYTGVLKDLGTMESDNVKELITEKEIHNIIG